MSETKSAGASAGAAAGAAAETKSAGSSASAASETKSAGASAGAAAGVAAVVVMTEAKLDRSASEGDTAPMKAAQTNVRVGVGVLVLNDKNQVLLGCRKGSHGAGTYALPGGHLEMNESWEECAMREVEEETGIKLKSVAFAHVTNDVMKQEGKHYVTIFMKGLCPADQKPENREPHKCLGWTFHDWDKVPSPRFIPLNNLIASGFKPF